MTGPQGASRRTFNSDLITSRTWPTKQRHSLLHLRHSIDTKQAPLRTLAADDDGPVGLPLRKVVVETLEANLRIA